MAAASETPTMSRISSPSVVGMSPIVKDIKVQSEGLTFTLLNSNVSFANAVFQKFDKISIFKNKLR